MSCCSAVLLFPSFFIALPFSAFALTWISKRSDLCYFLSAPVFGGSMNGGGLRVLGTAGFRTMRRWPATVAMVVVVVFILPSLLPGPMIWLYGFHGTKRRRCVDYVLSKNFLFASLLKHCA
jgi:hypothetical protein